MAYINTQPTLGIVDLNTVYTAGGLGYPWASPSGSLPAFTPEQQFGQITWAYDSSSSTAGGGGAFIFLKIPTSTTVTAGLIYSWKGDYTVVVVPTAVSAAAVSGLPLCVAINAVTSNSSSIQATWFQVQGRCTVLKGANVSNNVQPSVPLFISGVTAGRIRTTASVFRTIIGIRSANTATVASTTSSVLAYLNFPCAGPGV
jgi:hypothetical protein